MSKLQINFKHFLTFLAISSSLLVSLIIFTNTSQAATGINRQINFQGKLVNNPSATNVSNTSYAVVFTLYNNPNAGQGTALWTETQTVTTVDGIFRVALGSVTPFPANFNFNWDGLYLGIKVNSDSEMTPRIQMASVPFAFNAEKVAGLTVQDTSGNASTSGTLQIANAKTINLGTDNLTFTTGGTTTLTLPTTGTLLTNTTVANQTVTSTQTTGTVLGLTDSTGLSGAITGLAITLSGTGVQDQTGLSFNLSGATGTNLNDIVGTGSSWKISKTGALTVASCSGCGGGGTNFWGSVGGLNYPLDTRSDLAIGSTSTASALFSFTGVKTGNTIASVSGQLVVMANNGYGGQVGIGTTGPNTQLHIEGNTPSMQIRSTTQNDYAGTFINHTISGGQYEWYAGTPDTNASKYIIGGKITATHDATTASLVNAKLTIQSDGSVGIGTTTPANADGWGRVFDVYGTNAKSIVTTSGGIETGTYAHDSGFFGAPVGGIVGTRSNHPLSFVTNSASKMTILAGGNVGIGTTSPTAFLHLNGGYSNNAALIVNNLNNGDLFAASASGVTKFRLDTSGNASMSGSLVMVGANSIQTTSDSTLTLGGNTTGQVVLSGFNGAVNGITFAGYTTAGCTLKTTTTGVVQCGTDNAGSGGYSPFQELNGAILPNNSTLDFLVGGQSSTSANFRVTGVSPFEGTLSVASISGTTSFAALVVDNSGVGDLFTASSSGATRFVISQNGAVTIGNSTDGLVFNAVGGGPTYSGAARPTKIITLSPEYAGATFTASGSATTNGSMTSDASPSALFRTYYEWSSTQASLQDYTVAIRVTIPQDFSAWDPTSAIAIEFNTATTNAQQNKFDFLLFNSNDAKPTTPVVMRTANVSSVAKTWQTLTIPASALTGGTAVWNAAGNTATIYLKMYSGSPAYVQVGDIDLKYLSKF